MFVLAQYALGATFSFCVRPRLKLEKEKGDAKSYEVGAADTD